MPAGSIFYASYFFIIYLFCFSISEVVDKWKLLQEVAYQIHLKIVTLMIHIFTIVLEFKKGKISQGSKTGEKVEDFGNLALVQTNKIIK